jgi:hypothetical protein
MAVPSANLLAAVPLVLNKAVPFDILLLAAVHFVT